MTRSLFLPFVIFSLLAIPCVRADTIWISSNTAAGGGATNALKLDGVKVTAIGQGKIQFTAAGRESVRDLQQITRIQLDDEPALSAAEEALATGKYDAATDGFRKALDSTQKNWLRQWSAARLVQAATRANRFDAATTGYVALVRIDPQQAEAFKPRLPDAKSTYLATAIVDVTAALGRGGLSEPQTQALQAFLLDLQRTRGDEKAASQTAGQILQSSALSPGGGGGANPATNAALGRARLQGIAKALEAREYARVIDEINASAAAFTAPADQATALYYVAEARLGLAGQQANDPAGFQDAALAYMRVVAHFKNAAGAPYVARSLLKTAEISEKLNDPAAARALYEQILTQYPADPAATAARAGAQRLKAKP